MMYKPNSMYVALIVLSENVPKDSKTGNGLKTHLKLELLIFSVDHKEKQYTHSNCAQSIPDLYTLSSSVSQSSSWPSSLSYALAAASKRR